MSKYRVLYLRGGLLDDAEEIASEDLITAMKMASSKHPHLTAEVWRDGQKVAVVRPCWHHSIKHEGNVGPGAWLDDDSDR